VAEPYLDNHSSTENSLPTGRLDGWKDIAAYLSKAERTVKRWEAGRGLPIHRVPGGAKASVYAFPAELNSWLQSSSGAEPDSGESVEASEAMKNSPVSAEPVDRANVAPVAEVPPTQAAHTQPISENPRLRWTAALVGLAVVGISLAIVALSATGSALPRKFQAFLLKRQPQPNSTGPAISEAEKDLARDYYLKGRYEWNQRTPDSLNRALDLFTQAITHDPEYAQAYAGLADTYDLLREYSTMSETEAFTRAIAAAKRAVDLDDSLAEAHRALAFAEMYGSWDFLDAEKEFRRAIELDPNDPQARRWYANAFAVPGRYEESLAQLNKAQELDPSSNATLADKAVLLANEGLTQEAIDLLKEVERSAPAFRSPHYYLMRIALDQGDYSTFLSEGDKAADSANDPVLKDVIAAARAGYKKGGGRGLLKSLYAKQKEYYLEGKPFGAELAKTCVLMGRRQEALQVLETAYARHEIDVLLCLSHPDLLTLKDEPRYKALVAKIHFPMRPADSQGDNRQRLAAAADLR
jgi:tetratricopeptide (TPR) repeat protein